MDVHLIEIVYQVNIVIQKDIVQILLNAMITDSVQPIKHVQVKCVYLN